MAANPLANASEAEIRRFAVCFLCCDRTAIDWNTAAAQYDPSVKPASFKTVTTKAIAKILKSLDVDEQDADGQERLSSPNNRNSGAKKRKLANGNGDGEAKSSVPKKAKGNGAGKGNKTKSPPHEANGDALNGNVPVKSEEDEEE